MSDFLKYRKLTYNIISRNFLGYLLIQTKKSLSAQRENCGFSVDFSSRLQNQKISKKFNGVFTQPPTTQLLGVGRNQLNMLNNCNKPRFQTKKYERNCINIAKVTVSQSASPRIKNQQKIAKNFDIPKSILIFIYEIKYLNYK